MRWKEAMSVALYSPDGFFRCTRPAHHFRTSAHVSPLFAAALGRLVSRLDEALGHPDPFDIVDIGAGRGELLASLPVFSRVRLRAVELAPRPDGLDPRIEWLDTPPDRITGLLIATEWLDNVPLEGVELDPAGVARYVEVTRDGTESLGDRVDGEDLAWLADWWPLVGAGARAEVGLSRDRAWGAAVSTVERGLALAVDYGHVAASRPLFGSLTGFRDGRETLPIPDGQGDVTAAVAVDSLGGLRVSQASALRALGVDGRRPPLSLASSDPAAYVRALARAGEAAELTDVNGLGAHWWVMHWV